MAADFLSLFHRYGYIYKPLDGDSWLSADERWRLTDTEILKAVACAHSKYLLGTRAGKTTRFVVLDIDKNSRYHNRAELHRLFNLLDDAGLAEPALYRSSFSGGWHLYIFFDQPVPTKDVHRSFVRLLHSAGFIVGKGTLEVFPNSGDSSLGCGLRLPLQPGFAWLNSYTLEIDTEREWLTPVQALEYFMFDCRHLSNSLFAYAQLKRTADERAAAQLQIADRVERALGDSTRHLQVANELAKMAVVDLFKMLPPGIDPDVWWRGRCYFESGLTGPSQRADAIFCLGHYLFYGDPERDLEALGYGYEEERRHAIERILALKNHGHSKDLNRCLPDAVAQIGRAARWLPLHKRDGEISRYKKVVPIAWVRHNGNLKANAMVRIKAAVDHLVEAAVPFTVRELQEQAQCSSSTLYAHKALWHPIYEELKKRLKNVSDEYNVVEEAAAPQGCFLPTISLKDIPAGRLAARRVVSALKRQGECEREDCSKDIDFMSARYLQVWEEEVRRALCRPVADARGLKVSLAVLLSLLARSPDEEHQGWLQVEIDKLRVQLGEMRERFAGGGCCRGWIYWAADRPP